MNPNAILAATRVLAGSGLLLLSISCGGGSGSSGGGSFSYSENPAVYVRGFAISANTPTLSGMGQFRVSPELPEGLELDPQTGNIQGTPAETVGTQEHTVTANGPAGTVTATLDIEVLEPAPRFAYVVHEDDSLGRLLVDGSDGLLRNSGFALSEGRGSQSLAMLASGAHLLVAHTESADVSTYAIDPVDGSQSLVSGPTALDGTPGTLTTHPTRPFAYVPLPDEGSIELLAVDPISGATDVRASIPAGAQPTTLVIDPSGLYLYSLDSAADTITQFDVSLADGTLTPGAVMDVPHDPRALQFATYPSGTYAYLATGDLENGLRQFELDPTTGVLEPLKPAGAPTSFDNVDIALTGIGERYLYAVSRADEQIVGYSINEENGRLSRLFVKPLPPGTQPVKLDAAPVGDVLHLVDAATNEVRSMRISSGGILTTESVLRTRQGPADFVLTPPAEPLGFASEFAYITNRGSATVAQYSIVVDFAGERVGLAPLDVPFAFTSADPLALALHPDGLSAHVAHGSGFSVASFARDYSTGLLDFEQRLNLPTGPRDIVFEPSGRFAYLALPNQRRLQVLELDPDTRSFERGAEVEARTFPIALAVHPSGSFLYAADSVENRVLQFGLDVDGTPFELAQPAAAAGIRPFDIVVHPSGRYAYTADSQSNTISMFGIDSDGVMSPLDPPSVQTPGGSFPRGLAVSPGGRFLYVTYSVRNQLACWAIDNSSGQLSERATAQTGSYPARIAIGAAGKIAVVANEGSGEWSSYFLDRQDGTPIQAGQALAGAGAFDVQFTNIVR